MPASARSWLLATVVASVLPGAIPCHTPVSLIDADAELHMVGRQARGVVTVLGPIAGCRFQVSRWVLSPANARNMHGVGCGVQWGRMSARSAVSCRSLVRSRRRFGLGGVVVGVPRQ